ncbi:MAG: PEP-CTERM sorting domain-containing protein [Planctomycetota bacterium]
MKTHNKSQNSIFLLGISVRTLIATMILLSGELALNRTYATLYDTLYEIEVLDQRSGRGASLALDNQDQPHVSYSSYSDDLRYAFWNGSAWQKEVISSAVNVSNWDTSICVDSIGTPYISYFTNDGTLMCAMRGSRGEWILRTVAVTTGFYQVVHTSEIALGNDGQIHIIYNDGDASVREAISGPEGWTNRNIADTSNGEFATATQEEGTIHAAYGSGFDLWYAFSLSGESWNSEEIATAPLPWDMDVSIDRLGNPAISFRDISADNVMLARSQDTAWEIDIVAPFDSSFGTSLAFTADNRAVISFHSDEATEGMYLAFENILGGWDLHLVEEGWSTGWDSSLAIDSSGTIHLVYSGDSGLHYVPEPATLLLFGLGGLVLMRKRRT